MDYDDVLDAKSLEIEEDCQRLLALQQPMASDLRVIMTAIRLNWASSGPAISPATSARRFDGCTARPSNPSSAASSAR